MDHSNNAVNEENVWKNQVQEKLAQALESLVSVIGSHHTSGKPYLADQGQHDLYTLGNIVEGAKIPRSFRNFSELGDEEELQYLNQAGRHIKEVIDSCVEPDDTSDYYYGFGAQNDGGGMKAGSPLAEVAVGELRKVLTGIQARIEVLRDPEAVAREEIENNTGGTLFSMPVP